MSRYYAEPSQGHDQQDETRVQSIPDFPVKAGFTGESDKFRSPSALARANAGFEAMAPCYGWRSPHTRGARVQHQPVKAQPRIIPAYAGSTRHSSGHFYPTWDHPRIRGEHHRGASMCTSASGSSPHTRGARGGVLVDFAVLGIIPAYAGSTLSRILPALPNADHPRIRGEHFDLAEGLPVADGSSPHTRGAHRRGRPPSQNHRIIPAYAGSTPTASCPG